MTANAKAILEIINSAHAHLTAEEIFFKLKEQSSTVVLATVYNNLRSLLKEGLISKVAVEGYPDRYDHVEKHDHLVCKKCGALADITLHDLTAQLQEQLGDIEMLSYDLQIGYICPKCQKADEPLSPS